MLLVCIHTVKSCGTSLSDRFQAYLIADASILHLFRLEYGGNIGRCFTSCRGCDRTALLRLSSDTSIRQLWWGEEYRVIQSSYSSPLWRSRWIRRPSSTFSVDGFRIRVVDHSFLQGVVLALHPLIVSRFCWRLFRQRHQTILIFSYPIKCWTS
jgi:hypothetical protein